MKARKSFSWRHFFSTLGLVMPFVAVVVLSVLLFPRHDSTFRYHFEIGKPWAYDELMADFAFPIYKTDAQLSHDTTQLLSSFAPCFRADSSFLNTPIIRYEHFAWLEQEGYDRIAVFEGRVSTLYPLSEVYTEKAAFERFGELHTANIFLDTALTATLKKELLSTIAPTQGLVQAGERIIGRGEKVTPHLYQVLTSFERAYNDDTLTRQQYVLSAVGETVLVTLFIGLFVLYLVVFRPMSFRNFRIVLFFSLLMAMLIVLACVTIRYTDISIYILPFVWIPILCRVFFDARTSFILHVMTMLVVALVVPEPAIFLPMEIALGLVAVSSLGDMTRRAQLAHTASWVFVTQAVAYTAYTLATTGDVYMIDWKTYLLFLVHSMLIVGSYGLIYIFEKSFRFISSITLLELTDINSDLLRTMAMEAPGTFQHSMQVSNLATEAAKAIGANALLVRTGALYHDMGKLSAPLYYTENQQDGINPLLLMSPQQAAQEVIKHVQEGEQMARKHHLPEVIINFITSHHGTSLVRYFYTIYANAHPGENIDPSAFQYPGPKPSTKEAAILMMADAVEARSRSLKEFTEEAVSKAVDQMIDMQIADGQFADTPLSFKDVEDIRRVFKQRICAINHHRIAYPTLRTSATPSSQPTESTSSPSSATSSSQPTESASSLSAETSSSHPSSSSSSQS